MTTGRVHVNGTTRGIGFAVGPSLALTARHVIQQALDDSDGQSPASIIDFIAPDGVLHRATVAACNRPFDVASLNLKPPMSTWLEPAEPAEPTEGEAWRVDSRPRDDDPMLSGKITSCERPLVTESGGEVLLLQLHVQESLGDYSGYSGSPVRLESNAQVFGILIEQARWRTRDPTQKLAPVSNVLYAVPFGVALSSLDVKIRDADDTLGFEVFRKRMRKIKAIESEVDDPEMVREIRKEVIYRYVLGEE